MTPAATRRPTRARVPIDGDSFAETVVAEADAVSDMTDAGSTARIPAGGGRSDEVDRRQGVRDRLVALLAERIDAGCRATVERRLAGMQPIARAALLPSADVAARLARQVLDGLTEAAICGLLSPGIETERRLLLQNVKSLDLMVREASLDALSGQPGDRSAREGVEAACRDYLSPGLALLGAGPEHQAKAKPSPPASPSHTANEAALMEALRRHDMGAVLEIVASHGGIAREKVADAVWTRDARSLLALAWRAGYSMRAARMLQVRLAGIPPNAVIGAAGTGMAPMRRGEVAWQLALLAAP